MYLNQGNVGGWALHGEHALITGLGLGRDITSVLQFNGGFVHSKNIHGSKWGAGLSLEYLR